MITDTIGFEGALKQLSSFQGLLEGMRRHCEETSSPLFPVAAEGYLHQIAELQEEILEYLFRRSADIRLTVQQPTEAQTTQRIEILFTPSQEDLLKAG